VNFQEWIGRLLGLENVKSIESIEPTFGASWAHRTPIVVLVGCLVLASVALVFYSRYQPATRRKTRFALGVLRALLLGLLLVILAEPVLTVKLTSSPRPLLWVLFDGTDSMAIEDEMPDADRALLAESVGLGPSKSETGAKRVDGSAAPAEGAPAGGPAAKLSREQYVQAWLKKPQDNTLAKLSDKFRIRTFIVDRADGVRSLEESSPGGEPIDAEKTAAELTTTGQVTALGKAFDDLALRHASANLAGVVVVSDFDQNSGPPPVAKAKSLGVPIYTIGVGPATAIDLAVELQAPPLMKKAERSTVLATLRQAGLDGQTVTVAVTARRLGGTAETLGSEGVLNIGQKTVTLKGPSMPVDFPFTPEETGRFEFIAEVTPLPGEVVDQNNRATREVSIRDDFLRLMYVEYEPTWEWRFIKEVFHRDKLVGMRGFRTFLRSADPKVRITNELFLPTLVPQRSEFFAEDVIFLGDMPKATLSPKFCEMAKEFVGKFGGGLVVIAGPRFGPGQLADTALAEMLPVVVDSGTRLQDQREFRLQLTPAADQVDFMQLGADEAENRKAWDNLGPLPWYQPVSRPHPLATVLAQHPTDTCVDGKTPQPLIAIRRYGKGEVIYLGFNETWRLRRKYGELYYRQLWGQMIHRLGLSHALGSQKRFVVRTDRQQYQADDKVTLTAEAYDANFEPLSDDKLADRKLAGELLLPERSGEGGEPVPISVPQLREGVFETRIPVSLGGDYRIRLKDPVTGEFSDVNFQVTSLSAERRSAVRNVALQNAISAETDGKAYDLTTAGSLADDIRTSPRSETSIRVFPLWDTWLVFGVVVTLMLSEWLVRKLINLP
jgi:hypothetical protein